MFQPLTRGVLKYFNMGTPLTLYFYFNDDFLQAETISNGIYTKNQLGILRLSQGSPIKRVERRSCFRVESSLNVKLKSGDKEIFGSTTDLSVGGMCFVSGSVYGEGDLVKGVLHLPDHTVGFWGGVVWVRKYNKGHKMGIEFKELGYGEQKKVLSYIYELQIQELRRNSNFNKRNY